MIFVVSVRKAYQGTYQKWNHKKLPQLSTVRIDMDNLFFRIRLKTYLHISRACVRNLDLRVQSVL